MIGPNGPPIYVRTTEQLKGNICPGTTIRGAAAATTIAAGRGVRHPEAGAADLAGATVFLASRASDDVHGALLPVDGGWLAR